MYLIKRKKIKQQKKHVKSNLFYSNKFNFFKFHNIEKLKKLSQLIKRKEKDIEDRKAVLDTVFKKFITTS